MSDPESDPVTSPAPDMPAHGTLDVDALAATTLGCPAVAGLHPGGTTLVASYLPGRRVVGLRADDDRVLVSVVLAHGSSVKVLEKQVREALAPLVGARRRRPRRRREHGRSSRPRGHDDGVSRGTDMSAVPTLAPADASADEHRRRRRELIRAHHPDRGGDPALFIELLRSCDEDGAGRRLPTEVRFARRRRRWRVAGLPRPLRRRRPQRVS